MRRRFRLTPRAHSDLQGIATYSLERWGEARMARYLRDLERRFQWLADNPELGKRRDELHPGYLSYPHESHVIFYLVSGDEVHIIGVPHKAMDVEAYFRDLL